MASTSKTQSLQTSAILIVILSLAVSATARPCKTLFISSFSFSIPQRPNNQDSSSSSGFVSIFTEIRDLRPGRLNPYYDVDRNQPRPTLSNFFLDRPFSTLGRDQVIVDRAVTERETSVSSFLTKPFEVSSYDFSSLRDRTKDILSVVVAMLFGVGCGALTAATMYLVWSLFSTRYEYRGAYDGFGVDDDDNKEDEIESPKKMGYVKIPATESVAAPPLAKEVV